jgi:hypothetical protein
MFFRSSLEASPAKNWLTGCSSVAKKGSGKGRRSPLLSVDCVLFLSNFAANWRRELLPMIVGLVVNR